MTVLSIIKCTTMQLRAQQKQFVNKIYEAMAQHSALMCVMPTGGGKTVCFSKIVAENTSGHTLVTVHRREIVGQISKTLARWGVKHRIIAPDKTVSGIRREHLELFGKSYIDPYSRVAVCSVQTLTSASSQTDAALKSFLRSVNLAVFDEGHHYIEKGVWARAVHAVDHAKQLFFTASPERADGIGLGKEHGGFATAMIEGPSTQWHIEHKYLSSFKYFAPKSDLDVTDVPITASGDLNTKELRKRVVRSNLVGDVVRQYLSLCPGKQAIVFATDVATAKELAAAFNAAGVPALELNGASEDKERSDGVRDFVAKKVRVLVNVDLFDEGFDVPGAEVAILARPTLSLAKYLQMCGRVLRIAEGKEWAYIIDPVSNWARHGLPNWPRKWGLEGRSSSGRSATKSNLRVCLDCTQPYSLVLWTCPYCGCPYIPAGRARVEQVDGALVELDPEAMEAVLARIKTARATDEEYALDQIRRGIPAIGRNADMLRHQRARYVREQLEGLIAWWMGAHPQERSLAEKQRRFYTAFGVDVGTALTLDLETTRRIIDEIAARFNEGVI